MKKYKNVACGGTFDLFHKGHKEFLHFAVFLGEKVIIGITSDKYVKNSKLIESYKERKIQVEDFLRDEKSFDKAEILSIDDVYGPTLDKDLALDAIVVTSDSQEGAQEINKMRIKKGLQQIDIIVAPLVVGEDGRVISSTRIRQGEIDREGKLYVDKSWLIYERQLSESVRQELKQPMGKLIRQYNGNLKNLDPLQTITVGDVVTKMCNDKGFNQILSVIDFVVQREKKYSDIFQLGFSGNEKILPVVNPAGFLAPQLFTAIQKVFHEKNKASRFVILVDGEEDLAVLPVLLVAPLGHTILYGQPHVGVVEIIVTEESKNRARDVVYSFTS